MKSKGDNASSPTKESQEWMRDAAKGILHAGSWPDEWEPEDVTEIAQIIAKHYADSSPEPNQGCK